MYELLIFFFVLSIITSFVCSLWEAVLLSISPSYMQVQLNEGSAIGKKLAEFKDNIDRPLAAILSLNTVAHTAGAIGVGTQATRLWGDVNPLVTGLVVPVVMTLAILLLSEILPKTIGAKNWRALAPFTVRSLDVTVKVLAPVIWMCQLVTRLFNKGEKKAIFSRSDFLAMAQIGTSEGELDDVEAAFIRNLMNFRKIKTRDIMTPRTVIVTAPGTATFREFYDLQEELTHSRIPIRGADSTEINGYVLKDLVLEHMVEGEADRPLSSIMRPITTVSENYGIFELFNDLMRTHEHIANVIDSYGSTVGIVTMEDIVETLLGAEIVDESDQFPDMQDYAKRKWRMKRENMPGPAGEG
jgi:CBS domain containing-hemolysin-like protein